MTSTIEAIEKVADRHRASIERIRRDASRTEEWKRQQLAAQYLRM